MMLRSSDNTDQNNEEYHDATGLETPSRSQLPRMLSMTQAEFDEQVAEAIRAQSQNLTTSSTANRPNVATPNRPRRGSHTEEAMPLRQTSAEVSASGLISKSALKAVLELKRLKIDLVLTTSSEIESVKQNQISTTTVGSNKRFKVQWDPSPLDSTQWRWARVVNQFQRGKTHLDIRSLQHRRIATERSTMYLPTMLHDGLMTRNVYTTSC